VVEETDPSFENVKIPDQGGVYAGGNEKKNHGDDEAVLPLKPGRSCGRAGKIGEG
jgi:hypothetical protein